jgi:hypothetical protein
VKETSKNVAAATLGSLDTIIVEFEFQRIIQQIILVKVELEVLQMITLRSAINKIVLLAFAIVFLIFMRPSFHAVNSAPQTEGVITSFQDYLLQLSESERVFYLGFDIPIAGDTGWDIPSHSESRKLKQT